LVTVVLRWPGSSGGRCADDRGISVSLNGDLDRRADLGAGV